MSVCLRMSQTLTHRSGDFAFLFGWRDRWRVRIRHGTLSPGVAVDVEDVAVLGKAIDERDDTGGAWEDGSPLLEGEIRGDDRAHTLVAATDDAVEEIARARVTWEIS